MGITSTVWRDENHKHSVQRWASQAWCAGMGITDTVCSNTGTVSRRSITSTVCRDEDKDDSIYIEFCSEGHHGMLDIEVMLIGHIFGEERLRRRASRFTG